MKKLCNIHGIYSTKYCIECKKMNNRVYDMLYRDKEMSKFYNSRIWKSVREKQLKLEPLCRMCKKPATVVDHIVEIKDGGDRLNLNNLQSLCSSCHNKKTAAQRKSREGL